MPTTPLPEVPAVTVPRYAAPRVTATPVTEVISPVPVEGRRPGHYQRALLNVRSGELRLYESPEHLEPWDPQWRAVNDVPRETWQRWHPGTPFVSAGPHPWFMVPELLSWTIDSGTLSFPYLDVYRANELLGAVLPYAQQLLDGLWDVGGDLDWSAAAAHAGRQIQRLCTGAKPAPDAGVDADLVDYAEIVRRFPVVYQPELLRLPLDRLAEECEDTIRFPGGNVWHQEIKKVYGTPHADGSGVRLNVLGVRAWYRAVLLDGDPRPVREFAAWDAAHGRLAAGEITSATTDAALEEWAEREETRAARDGVRLLGAREAARAHRAHLRAQEWDRLAVVGADIAAREEELDPIRAERLELVRAAIARGHGDADIATRARMSRQAVHKIRTGMKDASA